MWESSKIYQNYPIFDLWMQPINSRWYNYIGSFRQANPKWRTKNKIVSCNWDCYGVSEEVVLYETKVLKS